MRGCRSAVATTSMLMLPATKTRPMHYSQQNRLDRDAKLLPDGFDVVKRRQSGLVAEALNFVGRCRAREVEMVLPAFAGRAEVGLALGALQYPPSALTLHHPFP